MPMSSNLATRTTEDLRRLVQAQLDGPLRALSCGPLSFEAAGLEAAVFRCFCEQTGGPVAIKAPLTRFAANDNDPAVDMRQVLTQEARLLEHAARIGLPAPEIVALHCTDACDLLLTTYVAVDGTQADDFALGALLRRLHDADPPDEDLLHQHGLTLAAVLAERIVRRVGVVSRITGVPLPLPSVARIEAILLDIDVHASLLHMDFRQANLLQRAGRVEGIIDWSNALRGDRAAEIARIDESGNLTPRFLDGYGLRNVLDSRPAHVQHLYRLDAAAMLAVVFLSESPDASRAPHFVQRVTTLTGKLYGA
jgi:aminoglycoside phosphotransferase (APT) family kinase protein